MSSDRATRAGSGELTGAQADALFALLQAKAWKTRASRGRRTEYEHPWCVRVHPVAARRLVRLGWAREVAVTISGRIVTGAELVHLLGYWKTKLEVTRRGEQAWRRMSVTQRYGLPEKPVRP